ncbi:DUF3015 family protein [Pigmentibacter sp. JX0631]|uniref:DUF3015 family protein n=1 Tax=Pigmentibacter sp. JX0631 TaxID=2976982 RepID=UPI002469C2B6|nr:DUF3015 family protein [Pigmentibacter sp. JX0631]WGL60040.1 DUF3015 family protein [Pigmentibacter sp. JX0631]
MSKFVSKKLLGFGAVILLNSLSLTAIADTGIAGCGLGSVIFTDNVKSSQILAGTTNATFGNQTFGITSGTSNCGSGVAKSMTYLQQVDYVTANLSTLQKEAAQGNGSSLHGLAAVSGCPASSFADFGSYTQANYSTIFSTSNAEEIVNKVNSELSKDAKLSHSCKLGNS